MKSERTASATVTVDPVAHGPKFGCGRMCAIKPKLNRPPRTCRQVASREYVGQRAFLHIRHFAALQCEPRGQLGRLINTGDSAIADTIELSVDVDRYRVRNINCGVEQLGIDAYAAIVDTAIKLPELLLGRYQRTDALM
jgi:hypothetical protein